MADIKGPRWAVNQQVTFADLNRLRSSGFDRMGELVRRFVTNANIDVIFSGLRVVENTTPSSPKGYAKLESGWGVASKTDGSKILALEASLTDLNGIGEFTGKTTADPRIDNVLIRVKEKTLTPESRKFVNPSDKSVNIASTDVESKLDIEFMIQGGTPAASPVAQPVGGLAASGWVKIAEVLINEAIGSVIINTADIKTYEQRASWTTDSEITAPSKGEFHGTLASGSTGSVSGGISKNISETVNVKSVAEIPALAKLTGINIRIISLHDYEGGGTLAPIILITGQIDISDLTNVTINGVVANASGSADTYSYTIVADVYWEM